MKKRNNFILFSDRLKMQKEFYKWADENSARYEPINVIAWLQSKGFLCHVAINKEAK